MLSWFSTPENREYLQRTVLPLLRHGLQELLEQVQKDRLKLVAGLDWDEDRHLPQGWKPFNPCRWLAEWMKKKNHKDGPQTIVQTTGTGSNYYLDNRETKLEKVFRGLANSQG